MAHGTIMMDMAMMDSTMDSMCCVFACHKYQ